MGKDFFLSAHSWITWIRGAFFTLAFFLGACELKTSLIPQGGNTLERVTITSLYKEQTAEPVDIVFVIDNSGSMEDNQKMLAETFDDFISGFSEKNISYHIGVISTDTSYYTKYKEFKSYTDATDGEEEKEYWTKEYYENFINDGPGTFLTHKGNGSSCPNDDGKAFISSNDFEQPDKIKKSFQCNAKLGAHELWPESGLLSTTLFLLSIHPGLAGTVFNKARNKDFLQDNSLLSIIILTDEDEGMGNICPDCNKYEGGDPKVSGGEAWNKFYKGTDPEKEEDKRVQGFINLMRYFRQPEKRRLDLVVDNKKSSTYKKAYDKFNEDIPAASRGSILDINGSNVGAQLAQIGKELAGKPKDSFQLQKAIVRDLGVQLDGEIVNELSDDEINDSSKKGYTLSADKNKIILKSYTDDELKKKIEITYMGRK